MTAASRPFDPSTITRPDERLMKYYVIVALLTVFAFPITLFVLWIKYRTLRYRFDDEGIWRAQGLLWRSEVNITYRRIQDIHLTNGLLQRWMGLSTVSIQTAAGSASPEVTIEGVLEAEALRDFLYTKMRGVRDRTPDAARRPDAPAQERRSRRRGRRRSPRAAGRDPRRAAPPRVARRRPREPGVSGHVDAAAAWIYRGVWATIVSWFRVPADPPTLPATGEPVRSIRPAEGYLRYLKFLFWIALIPGDILPIVGWVAVSVALPILGLVLALPALALIVLPDVVAYVGIHLRYDTTWYVLTDRSLRIRRGILNIHETTISFENVQNVEVRQGPLQRYFGIADVLVTTAGGGVASHGTARPGVLARRARRPAAGPRRRRRRPQPDSGVGRADPRRRAGRRASAGTRGSGSRRRRRRRAARAVAASRRGAARHPRQRRPARDVVTSAALHPAVPALVDALIGDVFYQTILVEHVGDEATRPR